MSVVKNEKALEFHKKVAKLVVSAQEAVTPEEIVVSLVQSAVETGYVFGATPDNIREVLEAQITRFYKGTMS